MKSDDFGRVGLDYRSRLCLLGVNGLGVRLGWLGGSRGNGVGTTTAVCAGHGESDGRGAAAASVVADLGGNLEAWRGNSGVAGSRSRLGGWSGGWAVCHGVCCGNGGIAGGAHIDVSGCVGRCDGCFRSTRWRVTVVAVGWLASDNWVSTITVISRLTLVWSGSVCRHRC